MLYQRRIDPATLAAALVAACGGGGSTASLPPATVAAPGVTGSATPSTPNIPAPTAAPTSTPTAAPAAAPLATARLARSAGFVNAQSHTVCVFDADLSAPGTSTCDGTCAAVWPSVAASAATTYPAPFGEITRSDGSLQLTYAGRPLYTFVVDTAPGSIAGNGITSFGNIWHIARPSGAVAATPTAIPAGPYAADPPRQQAP